MANQSYQQEQTFLFTRLTPYMEEQIAQWQSAIPIGFYLEIFRLHNWQFTLRQIDEKAGLLARWTQIYIFKRLTAEALDALKKNTPESQQGSTILLQLQEQLKIVMDRMHAAPDWNTFVKTFRKEFGVTPFHFSPENFEKITGIAGADKQQFDEALLRISKPGKSK